MTNEFLEQNYALTWTSSVMARKGIVPLKLAKDSSSSFLVYFNPWKVSGKTASTTIKVDRSNLESSASMKVHILSQTLNAQVFLQGKSTILMAVGVNQVEIPVVALFATESNFELALEINTSGGRTEFFKSPYVVNLLKP